MARLFDQITSIQKFLSVRPLGLISDIDGTISSTAPTPAQAQVSPLCRHYLSLLAQDLELVAIISGRPVAEMREMLQVEEIAYVGNHGFERWQKGRVKLHNKVGEYPVILGMVLQELEPLLAIEGIFFDNKGFTASIHYRLCRDQEGARRQIRAALEKSSPASKLLVSQGKMAIELQPPLGVNKGTATLDLIREHKLRRAFYLGDDSSDVDAFRAIHRVAAHDFEGLAIVVTGIETPPEVETEADFILEGVGEVEWFLGWLADALRTHA